LTKFFLF